MPRIKKIPFMMDSKSMEASISVSPKTGIFKLDIEAIIRERLGINKVESKEMKELENLFYSALREYEDAIRKEELLIVIQYQSNGRFFRREDGKLLSNDSKFRKSGFSSDIQSIGFDFNVLIKETLNDRETWYEARKGISNRLRGEEEDTNKWYKGHNDWHDHKSGVLIPYTDEAYQTLKNANEKLRIISNSIFDFITQEPDKLISSLNKGKLLT